MPVRLNLHSSPLVLASALKKVSADPTIEAVKRKDVAQMFIENPQETEEKNTFSFANLFATHPPIRKKDTDSGTILIIRYYFKGMTRRTYQLISIFDFFHP